ncbi:NTP transferase domain-containing protein [Halobacillus litoralis]|uniref:NTP transferase domain-containing protein n=1 Tax=Halobacillus litoralis TaxID=45668 RepID=A0A845F7C7_9BACI|nr:sugar phosphate nucleotidyltransferase [Halobacillus litoralis]MYL69830.1 NTP transferase domain-containing protein [Halobacillus litoralis]
MDVKEFLIDENVSMLDAMALLDKVAKKVLFVKREGRLVASLTDGDIRRWILNKGDLDAKVSELANYNPKYIYEKDKKNAHNLMRELSIEALPILSKEEELVSVVLWNDDEITVKKELPVPVVMMAGGFGTRLYPYTRILPKPLIPIGDLPIAEHIISRFHSMGSKEFHLIVNHKKNMIKAYFNEIDSDYKVYYADEDEPLGTGGGLSLLKGKIDSTFVLTNCDILIEEDYEKIYEYHKKENNLVTMVCSLKNVKIPYGVIEIGDQGEIEAMKEKPEFSFFTNTGMYIVEPKVIEELEDNQEIGFPDIIEKYQKAGEKVGVFPISENSWLDMGQLDEMEKMRKRLERNEA